MTLNEDSGKARLILAAILLVLSGTIITLLVVKPPTDDFVKTQLTLVLGVFLAKLSDIFAFYYGTSSGAKTLSAAQAETAKTLVESAVTGSGTGNGQAQTTTVTSTPDKVEVQTAPAAAGPQLMAFPIPRSAPEPTPEDHWLSSLRVLMKQMNPDVTEDQVLTAYKLSRPVDIKV